MQALHTEAPRLVMTEEPLRLDLGCGQRPADGYEGVDLYSDKAVHKVDLMKFPFPWKDGSVGEIYTAHFIEHIPNRDIEARDLSVPGRVDLLDKDMLFAFMDECWRILVPGGKLFIAVPNARSDGAFQDPTHRRFLNQNTFWYFNAQKRRELDVPHYRLECDYQIVQMTPIIRRELGDRTPEVVANKINSEWNAASEWHVTLLKPLNP